MSLIESIERGLDWLTSSKHFPGRLEMQTQRGRRLEIEVVSFTIRIPVPGGAKLSIPVFVMIMPTGSSPIEGSQVSTQPGKE